MMEAVLELSGATKRFGSIDALAGLDLVLREGEWLGLLGPNGAGKSTALRAIAGRIRLDAGSVTLFGTRLPADGGDPTRIRRRLGVVPQEIALYDRLTARENLEVFGRLHGVRGRVLRERVERALDWTGLADRGDVIRGFSGGMQRRLNVACGVLHEPDVVLLDEPTAGVDPQSRERIWSMLGDLRARGASIILTTHQLDEAQLTSERIVIVDHGRVVASGTFSELVETSIGRGKRVIVTLATPTAASLVPHGFEVVDASTAAADVEDPATALPHLLDGLARSAVIAQVANLRVEEPTLQSVFLRLTGKELRD